MTYSGARNGRERGRGEGTGVTHLESLVSRCGVFERVSVCWEGGGAQLRARCGGGVGWVSGWGIEREREKTVHGSERRQQRR